MAEKRVDFAYNAAGQFASIDRFADLAGTELVAATSYTYDGIGRLTDLTHGQGSTVFADYGWSYDAFSRVTQYTFDSLIGGQGQSDYTYDATGQLTGADHDYQADENYTYDAEGNRTRRTEIATGAYVDYAWDHRNRLVALEYRDDQGVLLKKVEYDYDVWNRRIAKRVDSDGNSTFDEAFAYVYDDSGKRDPSTGVPLDDIVLVFDDSGSLISRYLHGPGIDQVLAMEASDGSVYWALADNLGSVRDIVEYDSGTGQTSVVNHIEYDAFGNITGETAAAGMDYALERYLYSYTGREWDADAQLYAYRARWYDPVVGRFIGEDPIGFAAGDTNISRYVGNSVTNATDPSGLESDHVILEEGVCGTYHIYYVNAGFLWNDPPEFVGTVYEDRGGWVKLRNGRWTTVEIIHDEVDDWSTDIESFIKDGTRTLPKHPTEMRKEDFKPGMRAYGVETFLNAGILTTESFNRIVNMTGLAADFASEVLWEYGTLGLGGTGTVKAIDDIPDTIRIKRCAPRGLPPGFDPAKGFASFDDFKKAFGGAGSGQAWHHVVEQTINSGKFAPELLHNPANLLKLPHGKGSIHAKISGYYSSKPAWTGGLTVRQWVSQKSSSEQFEFGIKTIKQFGGTQYLPPHLR